MSLLNLRSCLFILLGKDTKGDERDVQHDDRDKPSTSKKEGGKPVIKGETSADKEKIVENIKHESDSETQNTSCSEESAEENKVKFPAPLENLKLLSSTIDQLLTIVRDKA